MKDQRPSSTALLIAASLVLRRQNPKYVDAIPAISADLYARMLDVSPGTRLFSKVLRQRWLQAVANLIEQFTVPGISLHYALRKKHIARLAREALKDGTRQVVVLGAGLDPLAFELHQEFCDAQFWELDQAATQRYKLQGLKKIDYKRFHLVPVEPGISELPENQLMKTGFDPGGRTFWIAEGLFMYLTATRVSSLMQSVKSLSPPGTQFVFTFMELQRDGRIRFKKQSKCVDWWLSKGGEPFVWGISRHDISKFIHPWRMTRIFDDVDLRALSSLPGDPPLAAGELICLAENS